ncbi:MAG: toxin-antitoxin system YwqK family antitoxin [Saprospiraceae bacterium]|nr:toxin-antitoxin system YwqK family antitoxin [Saprospiraceae bacterium]MDZ4704870.1 toxin-antitoxin system YwqK family antitoxin [Saprospiraceae bacterium]
MRNLFFLLLLMGAVTGCGSSGTPSDKGLQSGEDDANLEVIEATTEDGYLERFSRRKADYAREGAYYKLNPDGQLIELAHYENDTLHGQRILFFATGDTLQIEHYQRGFFEGNYQAFYPGGKLELEGVYVANTMDGLWKGYYENGQLKETVTFRENEENGPFVEYHPNGQLKAEGYYKNGDKEEGLLKLYNENGKLVKTMNCNSGICRTIWKDKAG